MAYSIMPRNVTFDELVRSTAELDPSRRGVVAIAGAPGSGKSGLAKRLVARLNEVAPGRAALLGMDGYHYDDHVLIERGLRACKGSPDTFDVFGLLRMLDRLKHNQEDEIAVPVFDRDLEISRAGARLISRSVRALVVEGNYLLLNQHPWSGLHAMFDITVAIDASEDILRQRDGGATVSRRRRSKRKSNATIFPMVVTLCRRANLRTSFCALDDEDCDHLARLPRSVPVRIRFVSDAASLLAGSTILATAGALVGDD
jgi:pantothenate kinase